MVCGVRDDSLLRVVGTSPLARLDFSPSMVWETKWWNQGYSPRVEDPPLGIIPVGSG